MIKDNNEYSVKNRIKRPKRLTYDILDGMIDWVRVIDKNGIIIYANKTMEDNLGRKIVGEKCYSVLCKDNPCETCITRTTVNTGMILQKEEVVGDRIFSVKSSPVKDVNGKIYAAVEVFRDVTRERKLERQLLKKNQKMSKDLDFARVIQRKILPSKGNYGCIDIDYFYKPSEMLSGDMFDVFIINQNYTGIYISDVVGHGITASMMTMFIRQTMRAIKTEILSPARALSELHKRFLDLKLDDDKYFTIFYGVIDNRDNSFTYVNGGHNCLPIVVSKKDIRLLEAKGYPICTLFEKTEYEENTIRLEEGNKILFYTDGIIEAKNRNGEEFGINRLIETIKDKDINLITAIEKEIEEFQYGSQEDDFAVIKMRVIKNILTI